jgi:alkylhydroperoxidase/carboxymuconolactone decarboxylase family protein YurZ
MDAEVERILELYRKERGTAPEYVEMLAEMKPEVLKSWVAVRNKIFEGKAIPRKYKELIVMAMCLARLFPEGIEVHMRNAMKYGATKEEVFEVMLLAIPGVGIPPFSTAVNALKTVEKG